ncbi:hypothetical protein LARV_02904 [Longilinea arvoryzae]|uniref:Uncharacterized protein n=1 Tax=Longilinea arvoryzae TaxID=360412 RepID=A0A0S7BKG4_9CHLR|nr:hypothetical protein [Longilinea arvoryzae]GAP15123.1 hypothetical protein LARV_02904 [Longilinea arvoryzae]
MPTIKEDRAFLKSALAELPDFLLSNEIYWPLEGRGGISNGNLSRLSLGSVRLAAARLLAVHEEAGDADLIAQIDRIFEKWRSNWAKKAALEYSGRLKLWKDHLDELLADPSRAIYRYEIRSRVILDLLQVDMLAEPRAQEQEYLAGLDARLRGASLEDDFVWEPELQAGFPRDRFWFLYRSLRSEG